jgi:hypothetical protein
MLFADDSKTAMKGQYKIGLDSIISSLEDNSVNGKINLFAIAADGTSNYLMLSACTMEDKSNWVSRISSYIEGARSMVF